MSFTYGQDPLNVALDRVRFETGDTDSSKPLLQDEELALFLGEETNLLVAAARAAEAIAAKFARQVSERTGQVQRQLSDRPRHYRELAAALRRQAARKAVPIATGISEAEQRADRGDTDLVQPAFEVGMHDHTRAERDPRTDP